MPLESSQFKKSGRSPKEIADQIMNSMVRGSTFAQILSDTITENNPANHQDEQHDIDAILRQRIRKNAAEAGQEISAREVEEQLLQLKKESPFAKDDPISQRIEAAHKDLIEFHSALEALQKEKVLTSTQKNALGKSLLLTQLLQDEAQDAADEAKGGINSPIPPFWKSPEQLNRREKNTLRDALIYGLLGIDSSDPNKIDSKNAQASNDYYTLQANAKFHNQTIKPLLEELANALGIVLERPRQQS